MWIFFILALIVAERLMAVVSPTMVERQQGLVAEVQARVADRQTIDSLGSKTRRSTTLTVGAQAVYPVIEQLNLGIELTVAKQKNTSEEEGKIPLTGLALVADTADYREITKTLISPQVSYRFAKLWLVALRVDYQQIHRQHSPIFYRFSPPAAGKLRAYSLFPALAVQIDKGKVGLAYRSRASDQRLEQPATIIINGSYPLSKNFELATNYQLHFYQQLADRYRNQSSLEVKLSWQHRVWQLSGSLAHATAYHHEQVDAIAYNRLQTTASYLFANKTRAGATVAYRFGAEQGSITSYRLREIEIAVQGNYLL